MDEFRPMLIKAGNDEIANGCRVRVQGSKNMTLLPDFFMVTIYNLAPEDLTSISQNKSISAFGKDEGLLFTGEIDDIYNKQNGPDILTIISVVDGKSFWDTNIYKTLGGGTTVRKTFQSIIQNAKTGAFTADDIRMIRGQTYKGRLAECVSMLARSVHGRAYITNGTVFITAKGKSAEVVVLKDDDIVADQDSAIGIKMLRTDVKGYPVGAFVEFNNGAYRLVTQKFDADNFKGTWESYLVLVDESQISSGGMEGG